MNLWKKSTCLGQESLVALEKPRGSGPSIGKGRATPSIVLGVDMSTSQNPPPSITHLNLFIIPLNFVEEEGRK